RSKAGGRFPTGFDPLRAAYPQRRCILLLPFAMLFAVGTATHNSFLSLCVADLLNWGVKHEQPVKKTFLRLRSRRSISCELARDPHQPGHCWHAYPRAPEVAVPAE